uniref:DDE-1 domain-containing protein n=1 Tax=Cacopsylla melanoneura TaxID=428564 RepID=A0A8D8LCW8_9HEMI
MTRRHRRQAGSRRYLDVDKEDLSQAINDILDGKQTIKGTAKRLGISKNTIKKHMKELKEGRSPKPGKPGVFTEEEECVLAQSIATAADWGFPMDTIDIRVLAKSLLDKMGRVEKRFISNYPGTDWVRSFLERNRSFLTTRLANNLTRGKAEVCTEVLEHFYDNLATTAKDIPPANIFNYDESNLSDDPGRKKLIFRRGVKYPDRLINHTKSATTIMVCGSASGVLLPVYVVYKSENLYDTWITGGPRGSPCCTENCCSGGTLYNRSSHGWFDSNIFQDWFKTCFLPHAKKLNGTKILIGDNLSSHFTCDVLTLCEENNIKFVCLPPHTTHLCQPLERWIFSSFESLLAKNSS